MRSNARESETKRSSRSGSPGLRELFDDDALFTSYEVERGKPFPDLFLHAAEKRGVDPAFAVVIEDTVLGVQAAEAAGMDVFGYAADNDAELLAGAGAIPFSSMYQVPALLGIGKPKSTPHCLENVTLGGFVSWFPAVSVARTSNVCVPIESVLVVNADVHAA